jgi:hypothetical protein
MLRATTLLLLSACAPRARAALRICDTKRALNDSLLPAAAVPAILGRLVAAMRCDALRVPILPSARTPAAYPAAFNATLTFAAARGLPTYASPMENAWEAAPSEAKYARWVADFAAAFSPRYLSVFNEVGAGNCDAACMDRIVAAVRGALPAGARPLFVGPDAEHVSASAAGAAAPGHLSFFDVLSSHNAGADASNTPAAWARLAALAGARPVWSSENPACFTLTKCTVYGTMAVALRANVSGVVSWNTLGDDVDVATGNVTAKGADVAAGW